MFKVALCSFLFQNNRLINLKSICRGVKNAVRQHCSLICFPESALSGLSTDIFRRDVKLTVKIPGKVTQKIRFLARTYRIYIAIGLLEHAGNMIYDSAILFSDQGNIILKYRRINPKWHTKKAPKSIYRVGQMIETADTPFGRVAFAICGDIFDNKVICLIKRAKPDYLIVPMSRAFDDNGYDQRRWNKEEMNVYIVQIKKIGVTSFIINAFEPREQGAACGGCFVISARGQIIAKTKIGKAATLVCKIKGANLRKKRIGQIRPAPQ